MSHRKRNDGDFLKYCNSKGKEFVMKSILKELNWWVIAGTIVLAFLLGIVNNMRVFEEQRVEWFGGPVVDADE